jgi:hypothetical protein
MKIVAIVHDKGLVETTLKSIGLWQELEPRGPPVDLHPELISEITREPWLVARSTPLVAHASGVGRLGD